RASCPRRWLRRACLCLSFYSYWPCYFLLPNTGSSVVNAKHIILRLDFQACTAATAKQSPGNHRPSPAPVCTCYLDNLFGRGIVSGSGGLLMRFKCFLAAARSEERRVGKDCS